MTEQIHLTQKERQVFFYKLLLMYAAGLLLLSLIVFWKATSGLKQTNTDWQAAYQENEEVMEKQYAAVRNIDSMSSTMVALRNEARQIFLERDIQNLIRQTKSLYNENKTDMRYVAFLQAGTLMTIRLQDLQTLNKKLANIRMFEKQLDECQIGFRNRQQQSQY